PGSSACLPERSVAIVAEDVALAAAEGPLEEGDAADPQPSITAADDSSVSRTPNLFTDPPASNSRARRPIGNPSPIDRLPRHIRPVGPRALAIHLDARHDWGHLKWLIRLRCVHRESTPHVLQEQDL